MQEKIEEVFNALQAVDMKPTPHNTSIMSGVYQILREIYHELEMKNNAETGTDTGTEVRATPDHDGRDDD